jgi:excisionase family DNA binding protein
MQVQGTPVLDGDASQAEVGRQAAEVRLYKVSEVVQILGLSRGRVYELLRSGRLRSVYEGRSRRVSTWAIAEYVKLLETEARQEARSQ